MNNYLTFHIIIYFSSLLAYTNSWTKYNSVPVRDSRQLIQFYQQTRLTLQNGKVITPVFVPNPRPFMTDKFTKPGKNDVQMQRLEEGSLCRRSFDRKSGYCLLAFQCIHAIRDFRVHGIPIDICAYKKKIPVICCPLDAKEVNSNGRRLSSSKCAEYHENFRNVKNPGVSKFSGKKCVQSVPLIVGGVVTEVGEYPHMAALGWLKPEDDDIKWGCGASLISRKFLLTAAHCTQSGGKPPDIVKLGMQNINEDDESSVEVQILNVILHPKYRPSSYYHDIALIELTTRVEFNDFIRPACLWQLSHLNIPEAMATGWGRTEFLGAKSEELQKVDLPIVDPQICKEIYSNERRLPDGIIDEQFCAGHLDGGKDTCQGDSGGPIHALLPELNCVQFIIGITSFGKFCAAENAPGVYTKISSYLDWIEKYAFQSE